MTTGPHHGGSHPRTVVLRWLAGHPIGAEVSINDLTDVTTSAGLTPRMRAQFGAWIAPYTVNTDRTVRATHGPAKGRRVSVYRVTTRPTKETP